MRLEITTTPRETLVWAPTAQAAARLRKLLTDSGCLVLEADPSELDFVDRVPDHEREEFDPARIIDVEIGAEAYESLTALAKAGHELRWHRWQSDQTVDHVWGVPITP
ncbi:MAG: hypothetical protein JST33_06435 [Actinobacteria bacterium]|nr:hypothetical protein [Actinomycetota bacterium]